MVIWFICVAKPGMQSSIAWHIKVTLGNTQDQQHKHFTTKRTEKMWRCAHLRGLKLNESIVLWLPCLQQGKFQPKPQFSITRVVTQKIATTQGVPIIPLGCFPTILQVIRPNPRKQHKCPMGGEPTQKFRRWITQTDDSQKRNKKSFLSWNFKVSEGNEVLQRNSCTVAQTAHKPQSLLPPSTLSQTNFVETKLKTKYMGKEFQSNKRKNWKPWGL